MNRSRQWIIVTNWRRFQHYPDRNPLWIKNYTDLLHNPNYLELDGRLRGILHGIWLAYAASDCELRASPSLLNHMLGFQSEWEARKRGEPSENVVSRWRVDGESAVSSDDALGESPIRMRDLKRLEKAGWLELSTSPLLADKPQRASASRALARGLKQKQDQKPAKPLAREDARDGFDIESFASILGRQAGFPQAGDQDQERDEETSSWPS